MIQDFRFTTTDGKRIVVSVYNNTSCSAHVYEEHTKDCYAIHGRDTYELLKADGKYMTKKDIIRMFNLK